MENTGVFSMSYEHVKLKIPLILIFSIYLSEIEKYREKIDKDVN